MVLQFHFLLVEVFILTAFGQCYQIEGCCPVSTQESELCRCDDFCDMYGDCCCSALQNCSLPSSQTALLIEGMKCRSVFHNPSTPVMDNNEAFFMISNCSNSWSEDINNNVSEKCSNLHLSPPVTDITTGLVYANEYCAHCNSVTEIIAWESELVCSDMIHDLLVASNLSAAINNDSNILQRECRECAFLPPRNISSILPPRSCVPHVHSCLPKNSLERSQNTNVPQETYISLMGRCQSGPMNLVRSLRSGAVYRNNACASCNADNVTTCFERQQRNSSFLLEVCKAAMEEADNPTEETRINSTARNWLIVEIPRFISNRRVSIIPPHIPRVTRPGFTQTLDVLDQFFHRTSVKASCPDGEVFVGTSCVPTQCPEGYSRTGGRCSYAEEILQSTLTTTAEDFFQDSNLTSIICSNGTMEVVALNGTYEDMSENVILLTDSGLEVEVIDYDNLGQPIICLNNTVNTDNNIQNTSVIFLDCSSPLVPLNKSDYVSLQNGSIQVNSIIINVTFYDKHNRPLVCPDRIKGTHPTEEFISYPGIQELTYVGCSLSLFGATAVFVTYSIFSELQTFPGLVLMNLCFAGAATSVVFVVGGPIIQFYPLNQICTTIAVLLHYFYLAQFSWMAIFSFETTKTFYQARKLMKSSRKTKCKYLTSYLFLAWGVPLLITATSIVLNHTTSLIGYGGTSQRETGEYCWINHFHSYIVAFLIPLLLCLSCNFIFLVFITILLCRACRDQSKLDKSNVNMLRVWVAIFAVTGLTWVFGFLAIIDGVNWIWYLFVYILNSTQGFSIFITFIFTKKIFILYKVRVMRLLCHTSSTQKSSEASEYDIKLQGDTIPLK